MAVGPSSRTGKALYWKTAPEISTLFACSEPAGAAFAQYADSVNQTGWAILNVESNAEFEDADQAYAAGLVEGYISQPRIYQVQLYPRTPRPLFHYHHSVGVPGGVLEPKLSSQRTEIGDGLP